MTELLTTAALLAALAWLLLAWSTRAGRLGRGGVAVTVGTLGAWAASSAVAAALTACWVYGAAR